MTGYVYKCVFTSAFLVCEANTARKRHRKLSLRFRVRVCVTLVEVIINKKLHF